MATATRLTPARQTARGPSGDAGQKMVAYNVITLTGALTLNEVHDAVYLPPGATVIGASMVSTDMDTGGSPTLVLALGDAVDDDRLMTNVTIAQAGGASQALAATGVLWRTATGVMVQLKATAAPATGVSGVVTVAVEYIVT